jgi:hypothetical protein
MQSNTVSENIYVPGTSVQHEEDVICADSLQSESSKEMLKTAMDYMLHLLAEDNMISSESAAVITQQHIQLAHKIREKIMDVLSEHSLMSFDELISSEEYEGGENEEVEDVVSSEGDSDCGLYELNSQDDADYVPLDYKIMVVNLAKAHPKWKLKSLQSKGAHRLKYMRDLKIWDEHIKSGGTRKDKCNTIDSWTYDRFVEARRSCQQVTTRNLQQWALAAAGQFADFKFKASERWAAKFKTRHRIRQRKVIKFVSEKETTTIEKTLFAAENFRVQARALIQNFNKDFVINTDQTGKLLFVCVNRKTLFNTIRNKIFTFVYSLSRLPVPVNLQPYPRLPRLKINCRESKGH